MQKVIIMIFTVIAVTLCVVGIVWGFNPEIHFSLIISVCILSLTIVDYIATKDLKTTKMSVKETIRYLVWSLPYLITVVTGSMIWFSYDNSIIGILIAAVGWILFFIFIPKKIRKFSTDSKK